MAGVAPQEINRITKYVPTWLVKLNLFIAGVFNCIETILLNRYSKLALSLDIKYKLIKEDLRGDLNF